MNILRTLYVVHVTTYGCIADKPKHHHINVNVPN